MTLAEVEALFDHEIVKLTERDKAEQLIESEIIKPSCDPNGKSNFNYCINASNDTKAPGKGFTGHELLSRDELNLILDLEDESQRLGDFKRIFPVPGTSY